MPQPKYCVEDSAGVFALSNPCEIIVDRLRIGVSNFDSVTPMRDRMVERMHGRDEGSLQRVVETIIQSRLYAPFHEIPSSSHDLLNLEKLRIAKADNEVEMFPHVVLMASTKPAFAFQTHSCKQDLSDAVGEGCLVVNPGIWDPRRKEAPFDAKVVEVTFLDLELASDFGCSARNGVSVGILAIYKG
jgi:hypothetical protein